MNRFEQDPHISTDEDGEYAYVKATNATGSAFTARLFALKDPETLGVSQGYNRLVEENVTPRALQVEIPLGDLIADSDTASPIDVVLAWLPAPIYTAIRDGRAPAWWMFDISACTEPLPDAERTEWQKAFAKVEHARELEQLRRISEDRGPWWWRARWAVARALKDLSRRLTPDDKAFAIYRDSDGKWQEERVRGNGRSFEEIRRDVLNSRPEWRKLLRKQDEIETRADA